MKVLLSCRRQVIATANQDAIEELGLAEGSPVVALIKSSDVSLTMT